MYVYIKLQNKLRTIFFKNRNDKKDLKKYCRVNWPADNLIVFFCVQFSMLIKF